jgi:ABC-type branched-subunit amino acid transport system substrate-binding protein
MSMFRNLSTANEASMRSNIQRGKAVLKPITLLAGMVAVGCVHGADVSADGRTIVLIGHVGPLTGQLSNMGKDSENGALLAIEEVNRQNLVVGGRKIELRLDTQDDAADPKTGTQVAQKLVDDGVVDVVGHINSGVSIRVLLKFLPHRQIRLTPSRVTKRPTAMLPRTRARAQHWRHSQRRLCMQKV